MNNVCACIVTYQPDIDKLRANIESIAPQVDAVVVVDNASENVSGVDRVASGSAAVLHNSRNLGIAAALNQGMAWARERQYDWVLSLDQDSRCPVGMLDAYAQHFGRERVGIISPRIVDRNVGALYPETDEPFSFVEDCMSSGACTRTAVWEEAGEYDEQLFIYCVDDEFCYRVRKLGYHILRDNQVSLEHELGHCSIRKFSGKKILVEGHSPLAMYYIARNLIAWRRKHHLYVNVIKVNYRILRMAIKTLLYEDRKLSRLGAVLRGVISGYTMKLRPQAKDVRKEGS